MSLRTCEGLHGPQLPKGQASFSLQTQDKTLRMQLRLLFAFGLLEWLVWRWGKVQRCFISLREKKVSARERGRKKAQMIHCSLHDRPDWETDFWGKEERLTCVFIFDYFLTVQSYLWHSESLIIIATCRVFGCGMQTLSFSMWGLVPWQGIEPWTPSSGTWSLSHWTIREVPEG